ncbi:ejaculatory bulb-specific protein 3-like [Cydia splendana]|uniref:ejaculatory bulb-specific protein 3-like n=1 Tax=Cydia splendana TaxID=1100963 RepID=UPI002122512D
MKSILVTIAVLFTLVLAESEKYTEKYDSLDIDAIIGNKRLMAAYVRCVLEKGKCTPEGRLLKAHITDALQTGCSKCTIAQKGGMRKVIHHLIKEEPEAWAALLDKYDPKKVYIHKYHHQLNSVLEE